MAAETQVSADQIVDDAGVVKIGIPSKKADASGEQIFAEAGKMKVSELLTPTQQAGMILASWTGIIIGILVLIILAHFVISVCRLPSDPLNGNKPPAATMPSDLEPLINYYKALNDVTVDRSIKIFDTIITKALLPIFTLILGYIFGTRTERASKDANNAGTN